MSELGQKRTSFQTAIDVCYALESRHAGMTIVFQRVLEKFCLPLRRRAVWAFFGSRGPRRASQVKFDLHAQRDESGRPRARARTRA
jgi:hypothetical protein